MNETSPSSLVVRVLIPTGMLGAGFPESSIERGIDLGADVIAVDGGSTDSGPYYLGTGRPKTTDEAVVADLRILLTHAKAAGIPVVVGTCGTCGTDSGVDWIAQIVEQIANDEGLHLRVACLYSELQIDDLASRLDAGRIGALEPAGPLDEATLRRCEHIVGLMGHEPLARALATRADVVLAGRATDTAVIAALPLLRGCPPGPTWHAAKTAECGDQCTTSPASGGVLLEINADGFTVEPLIENTNCTPTSVAAHMLYENSDPYRLREPAGTLDTSHAVYEALDHRRVRVTGSRFEPAQQYTVKLEGSAIAGYQTMSLSGIRDPEILAHIDTWSEALIAFLTDGIARVLDISADQYHLELRCYGWNAVLGELDPDDTPPREVGAILLVTANDQATATKIVKYANPYMLHMPLPGMRHLPSFAFMSSPAEMERGAIYEFVLQHSVAVDDPHELIRTTTLDVGP
jgi:acyclic terpene utilization AtuA family protein